MSPDLVHRMAHSAQLLVVILAPASSINRVYEVRRQRPRLVV
jgi:hypothetical protein